jgi:hypothetical protein
MIHINIVLLDAADPYFETDLANALEHVPEEARSNTLYVINTSVVRDISLPPEITEVIQISHFSQ